MRTEVFRNLARLRNLKNLISSLSILLVIALLTVYLLSTFSFTTSAVGSRGLPSPALNNSGVYSGAVPPPYYEVIATVTSMIDGDTTLVRIENIVVELDPAGEVYEGNQESVRYGGGIDAPESYMEGGPESTEFIENLIPVGTTVYLDLDNYAVGGEGSWCPGCPYRGTYARLIAVIYAQIDGQWVNINAELLRWGMEAYPDHDWDKYRWIYSEFDCHDWPPYDNDYPYVLGGVDHRDVTVSISPGENTGVPGENTTFTVSVNNTGNVEDNFSLECTDDLGWNLELDDAWLVVPPDENRETTLRVTIPIDAPSYAEDNITVTATSMENENVKDNATCIAHVIPPRAELGLATLYEVGLDLSLYLESGSKLVVKFYEYNDTPQGENVIWEDMTPAYVTLLENIPHPLGGPVENSVLVLTTDNTSEVISSLVSLTVHRSDLQNRYTDIILAWAGHPELHDAFQGEIMDILIRWASVPS
jgi:endonuclease YncB( thermonuclease family)